MMRCFSNLTDSEDVDVENHINITVVFPDSSLPEPSNGGFSNQDEFRKFVIQHQKEGIWNSALHTRPEADRLPDYEDDTIALAFPLQFPFGHTGLPQDPAVVALSKQPRRKTHMSRNTGSVLRLLLQHRKPEFHTAMFNLIVQSMLMKAAMYKSTKIYCNAKGSDGKGMSDR